MKGDATTKLFGTAGSYYIPVASNTSIRATRGELSSDTFYTFTGIDPVTAAPLGIKQVGSPLINGDGKLPNPATVADMNLKPMSQDEVILGFQQAIAKGWNFYSRATTSEEEGRLNLNWRRPAAYQTPRGVRFTARYEF